MQNFVVAYYAPTEGGPFLFFRWLGYSFIRYFGESNKLDLGFFSISIIYFNFIFFDRCVLSFKK